MKVDSLIFKAYDIRGIYPKQINEEVAYKIGRAVVSFLKCKNLVIGRDMRKSGPKLFKALAKGVTDQGCNVVDIGMCTTPMLHVSVAKYGHDAGIMISASHNPGEYNGFKIDGKKGLQLSEETGLKEIEKFFNKNKFKKEKKGKITKKDILKNYVNHVLSFAENIKGLKVVVDYGNGVGAISAKPVFEKLDIEVIPMYEEPDDSFPNHLPNPHDIANLRALQKRVKKEKADLGVFFDGDADRCFFVDENGEVVLTEFIVGVLVEEELKKSSDKRVYYDLRFSRAVRDAIKENAGKGVMMRVGNPFYKEKLVKEGGALAGEITGHIMFKDNFCMDDGLFSAIKLMNIICKKRKSLSELVKPLIRYYKTDEINLEVEDKDKKIKEFEKEFSDGKISHLDGITVEYKDWWFNIRKSNTEPLLRLNVEAGSKKLMEEKRDEIIKKLKS